MPVLSPVEIGKVAAAAGFRGESLVMAIGIAMRESGGRTDAHGDRNNPRPGCGSYGLWQVNSCPGRDKPGPPRYVDNPQALFDPLTAARAAWQISSGGTNWGPWTTYRAGIPAPDLATARAAAAGIDTTSLPAASSPGGAPAPGANTTPAPSGGLAALGNLGKTLTTWDTWRRVLSVTGGVLLLVLAWQIIGSDLIGDKLT